MPLAEVLESEVDVGVVTCGVDVVGCVEEAGVVLVVVVVVVLLLLVGVGVWVVVVEEDVA